MHRAFKILPAILLLWICVAAGAARQIVVIPLHHRTAGELIPLLKPVVGEDVKLSGQGRDLVVGGTIRQIDALKAVVSRLDHPAKPLLITVRDSRESPVTRLDKHGEPIPPNTAPGPQTRTFSTTEHSPDRLVHTVQAVEGRPAFISARVDIPLREHTAIWTGRGVAYQDGTRYLPVDRGFYAVAWLDGANVTVKIAVDRDSFQGPSKPIQRRRIVTTLSGKLGQWLLIGGVTTPYANGNGPAVVYRTESGTGQRGTLWLRVSKAR